MAESRQFGSPKVSPSGNQAGDMAHCRECEAMLADALDGTLSASDQAIFDLHIAPCGPCAQMLADARRGAAWLEMLRDPRPEPTPALLEKILAQTSGGDAVLSHTGIDEVHMKENYFLRPLWDFLSRHPHIDLLTGLDGFRFFNEKHSPTAFKIPNSEKYAEYYNSACPLMLAVSCFLVQSQLAPPS